MIELELKTSSLNSSLQPLESVLGNHRGTIDAAGVLRSLPKRVRAGGVFMSESYQTILLFGEEFDLPPEGPQGISLDSNDPLPAGPFRLGLLWHFKNDGSRDGTYGLPYSVVSADGRTVAGHIPSLAIAVALRDALNQAYPS